MALTLEDLLLTLTAIMVQLIQVYTVDALLSLNEKKLQERSALDELREVLNKSA